MIRFILKGWNQFRAVRDLKRQQAWMKEVSDESERVLKDGMNSAHSGRVARRRNGSTFRRSTPSEYPAKDSGDLYRSIRSRHRTDEATVGTNKFYSLFLRQGTSRMRRRKMSDNALKAATAKSRDSVRRWAVWQATRRNR